MSTTNTGGPAFPLPLGTANMSEPQESGGMTLRDYFAAQSISGINPGRLYGDDGIQAIAEQAYKLADAMLKAREGGAA